MMGKATDPDTADTLPRRTLVAALTRARRRHVQARAEELQGVLRAKELPQPAPVQAPIPAIVTAEVAVITTHNEQIDIRRQVASEQLGRTSQRS